MGSDPGHSAPVCVLPPAGVLFCKAVPFVQTTAIVTGILTMTCIAVERYQGIVFPLKTRRQYSPKRAYKMLGDPSAGGGRGLFCSASRRLSARITVVGGGSA